MAFAPIPVAPDVRRSKLRALPLLPDLEPPRLSVSLTWSGRRSVVALAGDLDAETSVALEPAKAQLVRSGFDEVVLDVSELHHVDRSGAVVLVELWSTLRNDGIIATVRGLPRSHADSPFELLDHLHDLDPTAPTPDSNSPI